MPQKKTRLDTAPIPEITKPTGVDTSGVKITPELLANQKTTKIEQPKVAGLDGQFKTTADIVAPQPATMIEAQAQKNPQNAFNQAREKVQPQQQPVQPITTAEKTTVTTPEGTTTTTKETPQSTAITKDTQWQDVQNKDLNSLEQLVEARYGTMATQKDGKLTANVGGKNFEWSLQNGQPVKTELQDPVTSGLLNRYSTASSDEIYSGLINGEIPSSIETQLGVNPNYAIAKEKFRKKVSADNTNKITQSVFNAITGVEPTVVDKYQEASDKIVQREKAKGKTDAEINDYATFLGEDKELTRYTEDLNAKNKLYNELDNVAQNNAKNIMKANPGIQETSAILLAARQNEPLNQQMESLSYEIKNLQANINYREKINEVAYKDKQQLALEERQMKNSLELYKQQQILQTGDLTSTDPYIQQKGIENAVNQLYSQYPIPGMETPATKIQKVKDLMAQGMTPQEAISQLEQEIRGSQRYKDYINPPTQTKFTEFGGNLYKQDAQGNISLAISGPKKFTKLDDGTYQDEQGNIITKAEIDQQKLLDNKFLTAPVGTNVGVECGTYARSCAGMTSTPGGNSLPDRVKEFKDTSPVPGGMVLFTGGNYDKTYGHIAVVTGINNDGTITIRESNLNGDNTVTERTIPLEGSNISGFYNNTPLAGGTGSTNMYDNLDKTQQSRVDKYVLDFENQPEVKEYSVIKSQLEGAREYAKKDGSNTDDQALIYTFAKVMDPNSVVRESEYGTVQEYSQDLLGRYAGKISRIYSTDGFLTQDAKEKMLKTLETKLKASESVMTNIRKATAKQLNQITGQQNGEEFLKDFAGGQMEANQPTQGETLGQGIDPMGKVPTKQGEFTNQDLLDTYNELLKENTPQEVEAYFSEYFGIPITR